MGSGGIQAEVRNKWIFGAVPAGENGAKLGSTGTGDRFLAGGLGRGYSFYVETDANATCSYQILTARTAGGGSVVLSSGTLGTNALDLVQITEPLIYAFPRLKTLNSTSNAVVVELYGN